MWGQGAIVPCSLLTLEIFYNNKSRKMSVSVTSPGLPSEQNCVGLAELLGSSEFYFWCIFSSLMDSWVKAPGTGGTIC